MSLCVYNFIKYFISLKLKSIQRQNKFFKSIFKPTKINKKNKKRVRLKIWMIKILLHIAKQIYTCIKKKTFLKTKNLSK